MSRARASAERQFGARCSPASAVRARVRVHGANEQRSWGTWPRVFAAVGIVMLPLACDNGDDSAPTTTTRDNSGRCEELAAQQAIEGQLMATASDALGLVCSVFEDGTGALVVVRASPDGVVTTERPDDQLSGDG